MSAKAQAEALATFKSNEDPDGPRVLILSSVGATGLNLHFANILIALVSRLFITPLAERFEYSPLGRPLVCAR